MSGTAPGSATRTGSGATPSPKPSAPAPPTESPFSKTITTAYVSELQAYKSMLQRGDYGPPSDDDSKEDWKADKKCARERMQQMRCERTKIKLAHVAAVPTSEDSGPRRVSAQKTVVHEESSKKKKRQSKHWHSTKTSEPSTIEEIRTGLRGVVQKIPTVLWLPPLQVLDEDQDAGGCSRCCL